ncbi:class II aldolase [Pyrenophora tritici-repentis]|nr:class II aldolase [Pyrenophora tritici-repentis]
MVLCNRCAAESFPVHVFGPLPPPPPPRVSSLHFAAHLQPVRPPIAAVAQPPPKPRFQEVQATLVSQLKTILQAGPEQQLQEKQQYTKRRKTLPPLPTSPRSLAPKSPRSLAPKSPRSVAPKSPRPVAPKTRRLIMSIPPQLQQQLRLLIRANHILHNHNLVDAFGHISVRHPLNKDQYIIAAYDPGAPALVKNVGDFISYWVSDSSPVDKDAPQGYSERFIHGELLRKFPKANCVVHSHSEDVIPFTLGHGTEEAFPVRPVFHMAGFMGVGGAKVFTMDKLYRDAARDAGTPCAHDLLIKDAHLGAALASHFTSENPVVLQHKHGFTTFGASIEEAVYRALYTQKNCILLQRAISIAGGNADEVSYLTPQEIKDCAIMNKKTLDKSFRLWLREVQVNPLYENEEGEPEKGTVEGMKM